MEIIVKEGTSTYSEVVQMCKAAKRDKMPLVLNYADAVVDETNKKVKLPRNPVEFYVDGMHHYTEEGTNREAYIVTLIPAP